MNKKSKSNISDVAYFISNSIFIKKVEIIRRSGGFCTIRFLEESGGTRVRENKLYSSEWEAKKIVKENMKRNQTYSQIKIKS